MDKEKGGKLFIVATPIGNLGDITLRALDVLKEVDYILCEDTRVTRKLFNRYNISTPLRSFYREKERKEEEKVLEDLANGFHVALVSDAGTPLINDPGFHLVRKSLDAGIPVEYIPGPSAVIAALVLSGFDPVPFTFLGYAPSRGKERDNFFNLLPYFEEVVVFFETPHRIKDALGRMSKTIPHRNIAIVREITKVNQEVLRGEVEELAERGVIEKGEITVVLSRYEAEPPDPGELERARKFFRDEKELLSYLKWRTGFPREKLYKWIKKL